MTCSVCGGAHYCKGLCQRCYMRRWREENPRPRKARVPRLCHRLGRVQCRMDGVLAAAETLLRAQDGDNDFITDAARKRLADALDSYAMERFPMLRGRKTWIRKLAICSDCGELRPHAGKGRCDACRQRARTRAADGLGRLAA